MWLAMQVCANDRIISMIMFSKHHPISNPAGLRILIRIPERRLIGGAWPVAVKNHLEATQLCPLNQFIQQAQ
ncbi:MAG TPA: hypothetical protein VFU32_02475, partial [Ktedonobacterales bacterium]|nr:hypothetical protein [Ktedonobacterales bacterium]